MPSHVPKIVYPSAGANELRFAFPPIHVSPFDVDAKRHDTIMSGGKRQILLERTDNFLELDLTLVPTEVENYLTRTEEYDHADWAKVENPPAGPGVPVVTPNATAAPDGTITADQIVFPVTAAGETSAVQQNAITVIPDVTDRTFVHSVHLRADSALTIQVRINDGSAQLITANLTTAWQRFNVLRTTVGTPTQIVCQILQPVSQAAKTLFAWGAQLNYEVLRPYTKNQVTVPADITAWNTFMAAVLDGTNFDYYPDAFAAAFTTYVLESHVYKPDMQVRGRNRFYQFKLSLRKFV